MRIPISESSLRDAVQDSLRAAGARFEILPCDPERADTAEFCAHYGIPAENTCNAILVASRKEPRAFALCVILATTRLDVNRKVCDLLGVKKASFASADEAQKKTGMMIGGVTPFGLPSELPVFVDGRVMSREFVVLGGGDRSSKIKAAPQALARLPNVRVVEGLANETPP